ncbi:VWA domain-containing protein [Nannocystis punicea]|uniref:VWA domain-containing protein n=1 Tax=Nannocystis punicea TaxID=2995304 RepID=A0ABY7HGB5_9BACT|nr:VWA domain-containing protein [Nannocystis poenicansa]WAS98029.1 VWA domain-containing protein [Nannocystis poenicansa]
MHAYSWLYFARNLGLGAAIAAASGCTERDPGEETDSAGTTDGPATDGSMTEGPTTSPPTTSLPTTTDPTTTDPTGDPPPDPTDGPEEPAPVVPIALGSDADILFVIDNSLSMATRQAKLAAAMPAFVDALAGLRYRIGITTTDSGNLRCNAQDTGPERGELVLTSCLERVAAGEFEVPGILEDVSEACTAACALGDADLPIKPTATHLSEGELTPRKWVEVAGGVNNLPDGVSPAQALQCFMPQGVTGCGFESHLESMFMALKRTEDAGSPSNFGFMRPLASLSVVLFSDETDCSPVSAFDEIFTTNKVFWEDPDAPAPTSALCWNAGVRCEGAGPQFAGCFSENHDVGGVPGAADDAAVLQPLSRYVGFLQGIEDLKRQSDPKSEVRVMMIAGVPQGYETHDAEIVYEEAPDPQVQNDFGIGFGCLDTDSLGGVPPVREREVAEAFAVGDERDIFSICADDYSAALATIAARISDQIRPACMPLCVADSDPNSSVVEPNCSVFEVDSANQTRIELPKCEEVDGNWVVPAGATRCVVHLIDKGGETPSKIDDMSPECVAQGLNLQFLLVSSTAIGSELNFEATCALSTNPAVDCPAL